MRTEKTLWILILFVQVLNLPNVGGYILLNFSLFMLLALLYFPFGFYFFADKLLKNQNHKLTWAASIFLSIISLGILFKLQHWPGGITFSLVGLIGGIAISIISYDSKRISPENLKVYYKNMLLRSVLLTFLALCTVVYHFSGIIFNSQ